MSNAHSADEDRVVEGIANFLLNLRKGFALVGRNYPMPVAGLLDFSLALLFYHIDLRCYILIDVRQSQYVDEFASVLNLYLSNIDSELRAYADPASIGILICREGTAYTVCYVLRDYETPLGLSGYQVVRLLSDELQKTLPTAADWQQVLNQIG